jgi:hypothetical protein
MGCIPGRVDLSCRQSLRITRVAERLTRACRQILLVASDSKAVSGTQPAALPCPNTCRVLGQHPLGVDSRGGP